MILVCGEALIDLTPAGPADAPVYQPCPGGGPFNVAVGLGRLGVPVAFFGRLSTDAFGRLLESRLRAAGVDLRHTRHGPEPTPLAVVTPGRDGRENEFQFYVENTADRLLRPTDLPRELDGVVALHVGTLGLVLEPAATSLELLVTRAAHDRMVAFDPNVRSALVADRGEYTARIERIAALADVVKVSDADATWLSPGETAEQLATRWLAGGTGLVVVTRGADGAVGLTATAGRVEVPVVEVAVVDTVGAGDSFNAGLLAWLHDQDRLTKAGVRSLGPAELASALTFAAATSALTCSRAGADPPWRSELPPGRSPT